MLGISVYPEKASTQEIVDYINLAGKYGYKRVFTCLLSAKKDLAQIKEDFSPLCNSAHENGMKVIVDVNPEVFTLLGKSSDDLSWLKEIGFDGIRLDEAFNGQKEANLTFNDAGLYIEINMSQDVSQINTILDYQPKLSKLMACHNFYPQRNSGLSLEHIKSCANRYKSIKIPTAAFVSAPSAKTGPWSHDEGLVTLEICRDYPLDTQAKYLYQIAQVDDIIISNQFASEEELKLLASVDPYELSLKVKTEDLTALEENILFANQHIYRGDVSPSLIRSSTTRVKYKDESIQPKPYNDDLSKGMVVVGNNDFGQYKAELQLIKNDIENNKRVNLCARVVEEEQLLLDYLKPWQRFRLIKE